MPDLHPIAPELSPLAVGESVAFREDHKDCAGMYGRIQAIGVTEDGNLAFDVDVYDPFDLKVKTKKPRRTTLEEIQ